MKLLNLRLLVAPVLISHILNVPLRQIYRGIFHAKNKKHCDYRTR